MTFSHVKKQTQLTTHSGGLADTTHKINCGVRVFRYNKIMTTLSELHTYWKEKLEIILSQKDDALQHGQLMVWLSFQLPLALDTTVPFYKHFGAYWCTAVGDILENRFRNIMNTPPETDVDTCYNISDLCVLALLNAGAKFVAKPSHLEKNKDKIEAYNQQKTAVAQFATSFHNYFLTLIPDDWVHSFTGVESFTPFLHNSSRTPEVIDKAQQLIKLGGFGAISAEGNVDNTALLHAFEHITDALQLIEKSQQPSNVAGLDGCNLCFKGGETDPLGAFSSNCNRISVNVDNENPSTFWHEWMHMLEERVEYVVSLKECPEELTKYKNLQPALLNINKTVRTLPKDPSVSDLYFANPYHLAIDGVQQLCELKWFNEEANNALLAEIKNHPPHPTYNLESFKSILRTQDSVENRDKMFTDLCNQWRNESVKKLIPNGVMLGASYYDTKTTQLIKFHKHLKNNTSNFISAAKVLDNERASSYWSRQNELLARSFEGFVSERWMKQKEFSLYSPHGLELEHVVTGFDIFMQEFKAAWSKNAQQAKPISMGRIVHKCRVSAPAKKRLTRF